MLELFQRLKISFAAGLLAARIEALIVWMRVSGRLRSLCFQDKRERRASGDSA